MPHKNVLSKKRNTIYIPYEIFFQSLYFHLQGKRVQASWNFVMTLLLHYLSYLSYLLCISKPTKIRFGVLFLIFE